MFRSNCVLNLARQVGQLIQLVNQLLQCTLDTNGHQTRCGCRVQIDRPCQLSELRRDRQEGILHSELSAILNEPRSFFGCKVLDPGQQIFEEHWWIWGCERDLQR